MASLASTGPQAELPGPVLTSLILQGTGLATASPLWTGSVSSHFEGLVWTFSFFPFMLHKWILLEVNRKNKRKYRI